MELDYNAIAGWVGSFRLLFFLIFFVGIAVWAFKPSNKDKLEAHAQIPLNEGNDNG
ncbi:MAG: cbb3-type cytochrome c oxidase subunit 3 [Alphaproteobacteria bacterium]|nr:cbb3-type cytochrome c oxidase subunit 3 [Alphaproteobacteria bacterium]MDD9920151.1 cbb3-type cytochrome c oxidase subunit 3 [Alphaproteobacteria bacterium]